MRCCGGGDVDVGFGVCVRVSIVRGACVYVCGVVLMTMLVLMMYLLLLTVSVVLVCSPLVMWCVAGVCCGVVLCGDGSYLAVW